MENARIAEVFDELAARLDVLGENPFKTRAYKSFAAEVRSLDTPLFDAHARDGVGRVPGAGKAVVQDVHELAARGTFAALESARAETPGGLIGLVNVPGIGAKTARALWRVAQVTTAFELALACEEDMLKDLPGFGPKKQASLLELTRSASQDAPELPTGSGDASVVLLAVAREAGAHLARALGVERVALVGQARRGHELVGLLELVVSGLTPTEAARAIKDADADLLVSEVAVRADAVDVTLHVRGSARIHIVAPHDFVREVVVRTGDAAHVQWLRDLADARGGGFDNWLDPS